MENGIMAEGTASSERAVPERASSPRPVYPIRIGSQQTPERRVTFVADDPPASIHRRIAEAGRQFQSTRSDLVVRPPEWIPQNQKETL